MKYGKRVWSDSSKGTGLPYTTQNNAEDHELLKLHIQPLLKLKLIFFPEMYLAISGSV